jgi:hypothetical protein
MILYDVTWILSAPPGQTYTNLLVLKVSQQEQLIGIVGSPTLAPDSVLSGPCQTAQRSKYRIAGFTKTSRVNRHDILVRCSLHSSVWYMKPCK